MLAMKPPAISGVSPSKEVVIMTLYPSIAATGPGCIIGSLLDCIPLKIMGIKLSQLLFGPVVIPFALLGYFSMKLTGAKYELTNRAIQKRAALGDRLFSQVLLAAIEDVVIVQQSGQAFYPAGDLHIVDKSGKTLLTLEGVPRPDVFRQTILEARDASKYTAASLATINARHKS